MVRTATFASIIFVAGAASAQVAPTPSGPVVATRGTTALASTVAVQRADSPMVAAAKRAVAARRTTPTVIIDNSMVRRSTRILSTGSGGTIPDFTTASNPGSGSGRVIESQPQTYNDPGQQHQNLQQMQRDLARAAFEEEQGPYSDGMEDRSQQQLNTIPNQMQQQRPPQ